MILGPAEHGRIIALSNSVLANELRGHKIMVNAVAPVPGRTKLFLKGKTNELGVVFLQGEEQ